MARIGKNPTAAVFSYKRGVYIESKDGGRRFAHYGAECDVVLLHDVDTTKLKKEDQKRHRASKNLENSRGSHGQKTLNESAQDAKGEGRLESGQETVLGGELRSHSDDEYFNLLKRTYVDESNTVIEMINRVISDLGRESLVFWGMMWVLLSFL